MAVQSIIKTALQNHPSWSGRPVNPSPGPTVGSALLQPGKGSSGGSPTSPLVNPPTTAPSTPPVGTHPVTTTTAAPLPAAFAPGNTDDSYKAYLTPDQLGQLNTAYDTYSYGVQAQQQKQTDAQTQYNDAITQANWNATTAQESANDEMAARGMFVSGIRDSDMADIARTQALSAASAQATLTSLNNAANIAIGQLTSDWGAAQLQGRGEAAADYVPPAPITTTVQVPNAPAPPAVSYPAATQVSPAAAAAAGAGINGGNAKATAKAPNGKPLNAGGSIIATALKNHPNW